MGAFILKPQHFRCKLIRSQDPGAALLKFLADLVILAKHAAEITAAEKNGPGPSCSGNRWFFTKMQACMGNLNSGADPAKARLPF